MNSLSRSNASAGLLRPVQRASTPIACRHVRLFCAFAASLAASRATAETQAAAASFHVEEATIADLQTAILKHQVTATDIVKLYLARIKAYNGPSVEYPQGNLGPIKTLSHAKGIGALITLNLRPATRQAMGFPDRSARSMTDPVDRDPNMPDALEVAAKEDEYFAQTGKLIGPLHGVVMTIKDQYDTFDMRTTSGADADYANDRPPHDGTFVTRLRAAGAIILSKANMGEYAGGYGHNRSSFGGQVVNPYDTERDPGGSSSGVGAAVAANFATAGIAEETGPSIRSPAQNNNCVGISPTQELVSRIGLMNQGINTRVGPIARTVTDGASILNVIAGYDPKDELTAFSVGHLPAQPYQSFTHATSLKGLRIGVVREYMDRAVATKAELQNIAMAEKAVEDLRALGATIVDPGAEGLFTPYMKRYFPTLDSASYAKVHPQLFPVDAAGKPTTNQIATFVMLGMDPSKVPGRMTIRDFPNVSAEGESKYGYDLYLARRGDANIKDLHDMATKAKYFSDGTPGSGVPSGLLSTDKAMALDMALRMHRRFVVQQIILQGMAELNLDAVVYPTGTLPPDKISLYRRTAGGAAGARSGGSGEGVSGLGGGGGTGGVTSWNFLGTQGFPAITVPGGFTTEAYDRVPNRSAPTAGGGAAVGGIPVASGTHLVGPFPAKLPIGFDFLGRPFSEPTLLTIAAAYEQATHHRMQPPDFGPLPAGSAVSLAAAH